MLLEYSYYDIASNDTEIQKNLTEALKHKIQTISVLPPYSRLIKSMVSNTMKVSCPIDYPLGVLDIKSRLSVIDFCLKNNVDIIEAVCPAQLLCNRKYDKFRDDIKQLTNLCSSVNVELRYVLEYRQYSYELLYKVAQILYDFNVQVIYPSTGYSLDDISDNIIASALINKKVPNINIICNSNFWNNNHLKMIKNNQLYGLRINSLNGLQLINS
jgi:deoxyribose-phosphate aldolase